MDGNAGTVTDGWYDGGDMAGGESVAGGSTGVQGAGMARTSERFTDASRSGECGVSLVGFVHRLDGGVVAG